MYITNDLLKCLGIIKSIFCRTMHGVVPIAIILSISRWFCTCCSRILVHTFLPLLLSNVCRPGHTASASLPV